MDLCIMAVLARLGRAIALVLRRVMEKSRRRGQDIAPDLGADLWWEVQE